MNQADRFTLALQTAAYSGRYAFEGANVVPDVFLYDERAAEKVLYVGGISTLEGLALLNRNAAVRVTQFGATGYEQLGWATAADLPPFGSVGDLCAFFQAQDDLGLVDFEADINDFGRLSSHDDAECTFRSTNREQLIAVMRAVIPDACSGATINALLKNRGQYIICDEKGSIRKFGSFDEYLENDA